MAGSPAHAELGEAVAVLRQADSPVVLGYALSHYGGFLCVDGDVPQARARHEEMLGVARTLADENLRAEAHYFLAMDALAARDLDPVRPHLAAAERY